MSQTFQAPPLKAAGLKNDQGKPRLDLIPAEALNELGRVLGFGALKYSPGNWANGIHYSRLIAAALRHVSAFNSGENLDPESGLSHIGHALCCLSFLAWMRTHRPDLDDRWEKNVVHKAPPETKPDLSCLQLLHDIQTGHAQGPLAKVPDMRIYGEGSANNRNSSEER